MTGIPLAPYQGKLVCYRDDHMTRKSKQSVGAENVLNLIASKESRKLVRLLQGENSSNLNKSRRGPHTAVRIPQCLTL